MLDDGADDPIAWPLGEQLSAAHEALVLAIEATHRGGGLSAMEWRVLRMLRRLGPSPLPPLLAALERHGGLSGVPEALEGLEHRGWARTTHTGPRGLTRIGLEPEGERRHDQMLARETQIRREAIAGIPEEEQEAVLRVLGRLVRNLTEPRQAEDAAEGTA